jgi:hypothetical protein
MDEDFSAPTQCVFYYSLETLFYQKVENMKFELYTYQNKTSINNEHN